MIPGLASSPPQLARVVAAFAQVDVQVHVHHAARAEEDRGWPA
jgi:hypothetical protein